MEKDKFVTRAKRRTGFIFYSFINPVFNFTLNIFSKKNHQRMSSFGPLAEIQKHFMSKTDISDHLLTLFSVAYQAKPKLIVELGVNTGESTFVFSKVASLTGGKLVSIDINDCSKSSDYQDWNFVQSDDVQFAQRFSAWAELKNLPKEIDLLFIDTSHEYKHTVEEIKVWFPKLSKNAVVIFHDTNLKSVFRRQDGSFGVGWYNERGVIRAIEEFLGCKINEKKTFVNCIGDWLVTHYSWCNGLTIMQKFGK